MRNQTAMNLCALSFVFVAAVAPAAAGSLRGDFVRDVVVVAARRGLRVNCVARSSYVGCYGDRKNYRAMPHAVRGEGHDAEACERECAEKGYAYFGREYRGQCFCGNDADYDIYGSERKCDCCDTNVGSNKMCVWRINPSVAPTRSPSEDPTAAPSKFPTDPPSKFPTEEPTRMPSKYPTDLPTKFPTEVPTRMPSKFPTVEPTRFPTGEPTRFPTETPTLQPTRYPSATPTKSPTTAPGCRDGGPNTQYLGCYNDRVNNRVLAKQISGGRRSAEECHEECQDRGYRYFGREFMGQCFCGDDDDYHRHREARGCDCCGANVGSRKICVWEA